jgi:hypothetical protein
MRKIKYLYCSKKKMTQLSKISFNPKISKIILDDEKRELLAKKLKNFDRDLEMSKLYIE